MQTFLIVLLIILLWAGVIALFALVHHVSRIATILETATTSNGEILTLKRIASALESRRFVLTEDSLNALTQKISARLAAN